MKSFPRLFLVLIFILILLPSGSGAAQSPWVGLTISVEAGFEGYYKEKTWIPVTVRLENTGAPVTGTLEITLDDYRQPQVVYRYEIELPTTSRKEIQLVVYPEGGARAVQARLLEGRLLVGKAEAVLRFLNHTDPLFGVLSGSPSHFSVLSELDVLGELFGDAGVAMLETAAFPTHPQALEALDVLVLGSRDISGSDSFSPAQVQALQTWTAGGGRLVITGGPGWQSTTAGLESSGLLPLIPTGERLVTDLGPLQQFLTQAEPYAPEPSMPAAGIVITEGTLLAQARVIVTADQSPLLAQMAYGNGTVTYLAFDPTLEPFASWSGMAGFYHQLLGTPLNKPAWSRGFQDWYAAKSAAQALPGIRIPSAWLIVASLLAYVLVLGPANYLLLRLLKRRELGWITIPATVLLCTALIFGVGSLARARGAMVGRISVMQVWQGVETGRVHSLVSLFSPGQAIYEIALPSPAIIHRLPTDPPEPNQALVFTQDEAGMQVGSLRLDSGSLAPFVVDSMAPAPQLDVSSYLKVSGNQVTLNGTIANRSDFKLETVVVHTPGGTVEVGTLEAGKSARFDLQISNQVSSQDPQFPVIPPVNYPMPVKYGGFGADTIAAAILGTTNYYDVPESYWRYQMLFSILGGYNYASTDLGGLYLTAWSDAAPYELSLPGKSMRTHDATLYMVRLEPELEASQGTLQLPPGYFTRRVTENSVYSGRPYYIYSGQVLIFEDTPIFPPGYESVFKLSLNMIGAASSGAIPELTVSLWDEEAGQWVPVPDLAWGENIIEAGERFVSARGSVLIKVEGISAQGVLLDNVEISMLVKR